MALSPAVALLHFRDDWDLRAVPPPASAALLASRMLWSARAAGRDAGESISKGVSESLSSLTSVDEEEYYGDPTDPTMVCVLEKRRIRQTSVVLGRNATTAHLQ